MSAFASTTLLDQLELADALLVRRPRVSQPQDLPGRYGRVVKAVDHLLAALRCESVVGGGWAVWHHGFIGRVTQGIDIVLPSTRIAEFLQATAVSGFEILATRPGRWPKMLHKDYAIQVD